MKDVRIAILGGGMLGTCTALELARRGRRSRIFEGASTLLQGASRWSEGKIHLGFVYAGDPTLRTAQRLIPGGLAFAGLVSRLVQRTLDAFITAEDEIFLVHRESIAGPEAFEAYGERTAALVREAASQPGAPQYLCDVTHAAIRRLSPSDLARITSADEVVAGYRVPERSISTVAVADLMHQAAASEPLIEIRAATWVTAVERRSDGRFDVRADATSVAPADTPFDVVINALWEGRPAVDASLGIQPIAPWSHRFRAAVFAYAPDVSFPSAVLCTGPFGDVKCYADGRLYLSWYSSGLLAEGHAIEPPRGSAVLDQSRRDAVLQATLQSLSSYFSAVRLLKDSGKALEVHGGWVYALGQGSLANPASTLHRRDRFNMTIDRGYISVDTAKYSLAPWLAHRVAELVVSG
jgi:glycine/D-amino acid oxidase-like deaminating enzyme